MMLRGDEMKEFVRMAMEELTRDRDLSQYEVYAASTAHRIARLSYTSDIPCSGVEEIKTLGADGFQIRIVMRRNEHEVGTATEAADMSRDAVCRALQMARRAAIVDPHFPGLPSDAQPAPQSVRAGDLGRASDAALASAAWRVIGGALAAFKTGTVPRSEGPGLVLGGDVSIIQDRVTIAGSRLRGIRTDQSAHFHASVTAIVESLDAKASESAVGGKTAAMRAAAETLGRDAVRRALGLGRGERPPSGRYRIVLGPQPIAEILNYMVMGSLTTAAFYAASSSYQGRFGERVMDERIDLADDPHLLSGPIRRTVTCEGLPARATVLIRKGRLVGLLSNVYDSHRLQTDERRAEKLGAAGSDARFPASAGYRLGEGGGRRFDADPGSVATNVVLKARSGDTMQSLLRKVGDGIYIGRIWYTYPINGQRAGDFTCTVTGDSYLVRNGKIAGAIAPNRLRINANISEIFDHPIAVGSRVVAQTVWGAPETYFVPALAADAILLAEIGKAP
jgi:predicted Zn-dependent protease